MEGFKEKDRYDLNDYRALIRFLRSPEGCPWDRAQTHESIRRNLIEEAYEAAEAIDSADTDNLREELGDLLMQVLLHADMEQSRGTFDLDDVADTACKKLVFRHPNLFGGARAADAGEALNSWEARKRIEKGQETVADSMRDVARALPALWRAEKIVKKAAGAGFRWPETDCVIDKLREETGELQRGIANGDAENIFEEIGDVLLAAVTAAQMCGVDPEAALNAACEKFIRRFAFVENDTRSRGEEIQNLTYEELKSRYQKARSCLEGKE